LGDTSWVETIDKASARIARLTERSPAGPAAGAGAVPEVRMDRERLLGMVRDERFAEAMNALRSLPAGLQSQPEAQLLRAVILTNSGQLVDAEEACNHLLEEDELSAGAHYLMALCREHAGDRPGAVHHDQTATYLEPAFAMPHLHLGLLERRAGALSAARAALGSALSLLASEETSRILLFGGGFGREALMELCRSELRACGGEA
jgi:chemotaxis protein methyltransferase CheR